MHVESIYIVIARLICPQLLMHFSFIFVLLSLRPSTASTSHHHLSFYLPGALSHLLNTKFYHHTFSLKISRCSNARAIYAIIMPYDIFSLFYDMPRTTQYPLASG